MLVSIGFENYINKDEVVAVVSAKSAPSKRMIEGAREQNLLVDATMGKMTNTILVMKSRHVVLSHNMKGTIVKRFNSCIK
ncbi:DUF370 domain-containing protein [uncultured Clostridium sp.]|uniref:DUF370 domain-containing protein n=1 Tax=uncultured Clostridium sp. TaxID=59620 RepID=UPI002634726B|nr:DUF370 domain-containing protein [uncultured Clostridium sp.]